MLKVFYVELNYIILANGEMVILMNMKFQIGITKIVLNIVLKTLLNEQFSTALTVYTLLLSLMFLMISLTRFLRLLSFSIDSVTLVTE